MPRRRKHSQPVKINNNNRTLSCVVYIHHPSVFIISFHLHVKPPLCRKVQAVAWQRVLKPPWVRPASRTPFGTGAAGLRPPPRPRSSAPAQAGRSEPWRGPLPFWGKRFQLQVLSKTLHSLSFPGVGVGSGNMQIGIRTPSRQTLLLTTPLLQRRT